MPYRLFKVCLVMGIIFHANTSFCQPGSGLLYFEKIKILRHAHSDIKVSILTALTDTFLSVDSTRVKFPFTKPSLFSLNKGKGNHKIILENGDKKMNIYLSHLLWGKDYGLLKFSFKEGDFIIDATISTTVKLNKVCGCYDLSKKIRPQ